MVDRVRQAAERNNRNPNEISILAASKRRSPAEIRAAADAGIALFGENYVPELLDKAAAFDDLSWHFIGHLQRNKARRLAGRIAMLHTLDTVRLADTLERVAPGLDVLLQVNIGAEATKSGVPPPDIEALARHVTEQCPALRLRGLMTIPPPSDPHKWLSAMQRLRDETEQTVGIALPELSMGMSSDLEVAIGCGATIVRVGSALFGPR